MDTYSPNDVKGCLGNFILDGFGPDDMYTVEIQGDTVKHVRGLTGKFARIVDRAPQLLRVTIQVMQTSAVNSILNTLHDAQRIPGSLPLPFSLKNLIGGEGAIIPEASIVKKPGPAFGADVKMREWVIEGPGEVTSAGAQ